MTKPAQEKTWRTCKYGHRYQKSSDCPTCPVCEDLKRRKEGFMATLAAPARRALQNANIFTLDTLSKYSEAELLKLHGIGKTTLPKLKAELEKAGLHFRN